MTSEARVPRGPLARRVLTDPLTLFLALGALCYGLWAAAGPERAKATIVVTPEVVAALEADFRVFEGRPATAADRAALIDRWVEDRILFHEALARGLHLGDPKTEHRLVDKLRFLLAEAPPEPTPAQLLDHYVAHADDYTSEWRLSFEHRWFPDAEALVAHVAQVQDADEHEADAKQRGEQTLATLVENLQEAGVKAEGLMLFADDVAKAILNTAKARDCSMIVLGLTGKGIFKRLIAGDIPTDIIRQADLPVLLCPANWVGMI